MTNALTVLAILVAVGFGLIGAAKVLALPPMRHRAAELGFSVTAYRGIGVLECAGAAGVVIGLVVPVIGWMAAVGLLLLLAGALGTHLRNRDGIRQLTPALVFAALDAAYLGVAIAVR